MIKYTKHNYIPNLYNNIKDDKYYTFLKNNMCGFEIKSIRDEIEKMGICQMDELVNFLSKGYLSDELVNRFSIKNVISINSLQYKNLSSSNFVVSYNTTAERGSYQKTITLDTNSSDIRKRSIVIYFRGVWRDEDNTSFVDPFQCTVLYKVLLKLIDNGVFKLFNDVVMVQTDPLSEEYEVFSENHITVDKSVGKDFINRTCVFSNTIHFSIGELPDLKSYTKPIVSNYLMSESDSYVKMDILFPELKYSDDGEASFGVDREFSIGGSIFSWSELMDNEEFIKLYRNSKNRSLESMISEITNKIFILEEEILKL